MFLNMFEPIEQFVDIEGCNFRDILIPDAIGERFLFQAHTVTFWAIYGGDKLICPLLSCSRVIILHDFVEIVDNAIVCTDIVGRGFCLFLRYLYVFKCTI